MTELPKNHDRYWVPGLARGLDILKVLADARHPLPAAEIAKRIGLTRSSVFRLLYTLQYLGYVEEPHAGRGYDLSARVLQLGYGYLAGRDIVGVARPVLYGLAQETGLSTHLGVLSSGDVVYLMHAPGRTGYVSTINAGDRFPAYASPVGLAVLAGKSEEALRGLFGGATVGAPGTPPIAIAEIVRRVDEVRNAGVAFDRRTGEHNGQSVAAPIFGYEGNVRAAIGLSGPVGAFTVSDLDEKLRPLLMQAAAEVSRRLGYLEH